MTPNRRTLLAALIATLAHGQAQAGCLDWLFGHHTPQPTPYAVGYAPQTTVTPLGPPTLVGTAVSPYAAGYAPYTAGYSGNASGTIGLPSAIAAQAPAYGVAPSYGLTPGYGLAPTYGAAPAYGAAPVTAYSVPLDNPSVLTGRPVMQTSANAAIGLPAAPPAASVPAPQPQTSWLGKVFGNDYQTSYYNVPTTTYRPVTQVDPTTGATVIVQQPCTSLTQQVQRSPYTSLQPAPAVTPSPYYGEPTCGGEPPRYAPPTTLPPASPMPGYAPATTYPPAAAYGAPAGASGLSSLGGASGVAQAGATTLPGYAAPYAQPIPTTGSYGGLPAPLTQPNTQPLTGSGSGSGYGGIGSATSDTTPMTQPQMDSYRPSWNSTSPLVPVTPPPSAFPSTTPGLPSTLEAPPLTSSPWSGAREANAPAPGSTSAPSTPADRYTNLAPIPAADNYRAPTWSDLYSRPQASTVDSGRDRANPSAQRQPSLTEPRTAETNLGSGVTKAQYASTSDLPLLPKSEASASAAPVRQVWNEQPQQPKRDDSGWVALEPR